MKTLSVGFTSMVGPAVTRQSMLRKALLVCGIVSSLLYIVANILGAIQFEGYDFTSQTVSELIAIDAPSRPLVVILMTLYSLLIYAFGLGVWQSAGQKRALRAAACLIIGKEIIGLIVTLFFPIHLRGVETTYTDAMHGILTAVGVLLCMFPAMGFASAAFGKRFQFYSLGTMLIFLLCGILTFLISPQMGANLPTPWMGVLERVNIFGYMLWIVVLAVKLIQIPPAGFKPDDGQK